MGFKMLIDHCIPVNICRDYKIIYFVALINDVTAVADPEHMNKFVNPMNIVTLRNFIAVYIFEWGNF